LKILLSKRAITRVQGIVILVLIVAVGLGAYYFALQPAGPSATATTSLKEVTVATKDTLIMGTTDAVWTTIDPSDAYDAFAWLLINNLGSPLIDIAPGSAAGPNDLVPALAESWSMSSDGLTWTFNLKKGVMFSDGVEFTADDVKYSFDRGMTIANPEGAVVGIGYSDIIDSVAVVSKYQVKFNLKLPAAFFGQLMAAVPSYIVNPRFAPMKYFRINYTEGDARASSPLDLGPYTLTHWKRAGAKDQEMRLDANPYYWNAAAGYPKTKHMILKFYSDATALALAIQSGDVDLAYKELTPTDIQSLQKNPQVKVWQGPSQFIQYMVFQEHIKPFDDPEVRRAIAAAVDRKAICDTVFLGQAIPLYSMVANGMAYHVDSFKKLGDMNYEYTKTTLAKHGYSETKKLSFDLWYESSGHYQSSSDIALVVRNSLEKSGVIQVNLKSAAWATFRSTIKAESIAVWIIGWYPDYVDPDNYVFPLLNSKVSGWNHHNYKNPQFDQLSDQQRVEVDPAKRAQLLASLQDLIAEDVPVVPLFQRSNWAVSKPNVDGVVLDISMIFRFGGIVVKEQ